jgi:hypothetical protein
MANRSSGLTKWLGELPVKFALFSGAAAALVAFFAPENAFPQPLEALRTFASFMVVVALIASWAMRDRLVANPTRIVWIAAGLLLLLIVLHILFVRAVHFTDSSEPEYYVIGASVTDPAQRDMDDADLIRQTGGSWSDLRSIWGNGFVAAALAYGLTYLLFVQGCVMAIGALTLPKSGSAKTRSTTRKVEPVTK